MTAASPIPSFLEAAQSEEVRQRPRVMRTFELATAGEDEEMDVIGIVLEALSKLPGDGPKRVLDFVQSRLADKAVLKLERPR